MTLGTKTVSEQDASYPMPTPVDTGHGGFGDGLFTKPPIGSFKMPNPNYYLPVGGPEARTRARSDRRGCRQLRRLPSAGAAGSRSGGTSHSS